MNSRALKISGFLAAAAALVAILVLTAATYAWFTFSTDTYVTPMSGTVSQGGGDLLISNLPDSGFGLTAELLTGSVESSCRAPRRTWHSSIPARSRRPTG